MREIKVREVVRGGAEPGSGMAGLHVKVVTRGNARRGVPTCVAMNRSEVVVATAKSVLILVAGNTHGVAITRGVVENCLFARLRCTAGAEAI